jgi:uncharacterized Zn finger protein (UPF0148 family)
MSQAANSSHRHKHVCIFELERKGASFTGEVVCTVCGAYVSSQNDASKQADAAPRTENQSHP